MDNYTQYELLQERIQFLERENDYLRKQLKEYKLSAATRQENAQKKKDGTEALEELFERNAGAYYIPKDSLLNSTESFGYYSIRQMIQGLKSNGNIRQSLYLFPQVALHSIIKLTELGEHYDLDTDLFFTRKYLSKSVDFLICSLEIRESISYNATSHKEYLYKPLLAVEIDGSFHKSDDQTARDKVKNAVFDAIGIPLVRYDLTDKRRAKLEDVVRDTLLKVLS